MTLTFSLWLEVHFFRPQRCVVDGQVYQECKRNGVGYKFPINAGASVEDRGFHGPWCEPMALAPIITLSRRIRICSGLESLQYEGLLCINSSGI